MRDALPYWRTALCTTPNPISEAAKQMTAKMRAVCVCSIPNITYCKADMVDEKKTMKEQVAAVICTEIWKQISITGSTLMSWLQYLKNLNWWEDVTFNYLIILFNRNDNNWTRRLPRVLFQPEEEAGLWAFHLQFQRHLPKSLLIMPFVGREVFLMVHL